MSDVCSKRYDGFTGSTSCCLLWGEKVSVYNDCIWVWSPKREGLPVITMLLTGSDPCCGHCELFPWGSNFIALCVFINWWILSLYENYRNVFSAVAPPCWAACVMFWTGRQSDDAKFWKFLYVVFCLFTVGCRAWEHITVIWIKCSVYLGHQMLYKM
jgi:hypothetical protein